MKCSDCDEEIVGSVILVRDADPIAEEPMEWGVLTTHLSTEGVFVMFHPNCFKVFQDEVLRQERSGAFIILIGKVDDVKEGLSIP